MLCMITTKSTNFPLKQLYSRLSLFINTKLVSSLNLYRKQYHLAIICCCICMDCFTKNHASTCKHHTILLRDGGYANWWAQYLPTLINFKSTSFRWNCWHVIIIVFYFINPWWLKVNQMKFFKLLRGPSEYMETFGNFCKCVWWLITLLVDLACSLYYG